MTLPTYQFLGHFPHITLTKIMFTITSPQSKKEWEKESRNKLVEPDITLITEILWTMKFIFRIVYFLFTANDLIYLQCFMFLLNTHTLWYVWYSVLLVSLAFLSILERWNQHFSFFFWLYLKQRTAYQSSNNDNLWLYHNQFGSFHIQ